MALEIKNSELKNDFFIQYFLMPPLLFLNLIPLLEQYLQKFEVPG